MRENLALLLQEALSAIARIRRGEAVQDSVSFRSKLIAALQRTEEQARVNGYSGPDVKSSIFAVTAMADETVLGSKLPVFSEWHKRPLCLELFKTNRGGEIFFHNIAAALERDSSPDTGDVLEVYLLCLLLGFAGQYRNNETSEIQVWKHKVREKIRHIRGAAPGLPDLWRIPSETVQPRRDIIADRLKKALIAAAVIAVAVFATAKLNLILKTGELQSLSEVRQGK
jgi:type IV/VI secretion system ImpK/VasF family protein